LALGIALRGLRTPVVGYCVSRSAGEQRSKVAALIEQVCARLNVAPPLKGSDLVLEEGVLGAGYGQPTAAMQEAVNLVASLEGLALDPVYTGKAMAGLIAGIRAGRFDRNDTVVFIHTGGASSLFAYPDVFAEQPATTSA
jgi:1-aminocyclopropane-1-carboxylate deaminase/D-cysteine desulfhydrase-like pyridoxal-dependent ACC family enzyme